MNSFITCSMIYVDTEADESLSKKSSTRAGTIYMEGSKLGIISESNRYQNCYNTTEGGVFFLVGTKIVEKNSAFFALQALYGSVMKCSDCDFSFTNSNLDNNKALYGGIFNIENSASGTVTSSSLIGTKAIY